MILHTEKALTGLPATKVAFSEMIFYQSEERISRRFDLHFVRIFLRQKWFEETEGIKLTGSNESS